MAQISIKLTKKDGTKYEINRANGLRSVNVLTQSNPNTTSINYGVFESSAQFNSIDVNQEIKEMIKSDLIENSDIETDVYVNGYKKHTFMTGGSNYSVSGSNFNVSLKEKIDFNKQIPGLDKAGDATSLLNILKYEIISKNKGLSNSIFGANRFFGADYKGIPSFYGDAGESFTGYATNKSYSFISGDKYYCCFYARVIKDDSGSISTPYKIEFQFPNYSNYTPMYADDVHILYDYAGNNWVKVSGFLLPHPNAPITRSSMLVKFYNNGESDVTAQIKDLNIINLTQNGLADKTLEWCNQNLNLLDCLNLQKLIVYKGAYNNYVYGSVESYLDSIKINTPILEKDTLRNQINKICEIAQLNAFVNVDGKISFINARPIEDQSLRSLSIKIPRKKQYSRFEIDILNKTKFNNISYTDRKYVKSEEYQSVYSCDVDVFSGDTFIATNSSYNKEFSSVGVITYGNPISATSGTTGVTLRSAMKVIPTQQTSSESDCYAVLTKTYSGGTVATETISISTSDRASIDSPNSFIFENVPNEEGYYFNFWVKVKFPQDSLITEQNVSKFSITVYKKTYTITEETKQYGQGNKVFEFAGNELLLTNSKNTLNDEKTQDTINSNIIYDYSDGKMSGKLTISCGDYYDLDDDRSIKWEYGQMPSVGEIVRVDKDNNGVSMYIDANGNDIYWKIIGTRFRYSGCPYIDLELQEVKFV